MTAKETVDLKVLLKLPMTKLKDLRRFLANHNIKFMPSDAHLYKDMRGIYESYITQCSDRVDHRYLKGDFE